MAVNKRGGAGRRRARERGEKASERFSVLVDEDTKKALDLAARKSGRTLSYEAALRLKSSVSEERASLGAADPHNEVLATAVALTGQGVEKIAGLSWRSDRFTFGNLEAGIQVLLAHWAPGGPVEIPENVKKLGEGLSDYVNPGAIGRSVAMGLLTMIEHAPALAPAHPQWRAMQVWRMLHDKIEGGKS